MKKMKTLKKNYEFKNVLTKGKFYIGNQITIYITNNKQPINQIGIAIASKSYHAVQRNYLKRKIRENYRLLEKDLKVGYNIVFLWNKKIEAKQADFYKIQEDMKKSFQKVGILKI